MRAATLLLTLSAVAAQTPQFEVASVKPSLPGATSGAISGGPGTNDPSLFTCENIHLKNLVLIAYDLPDYRYSGPDWMRSVRFNISARIPEGATKEQFRSMLQGLLAERFKLAFHWEKKEMQTYNLVLAKNGPKLMQSLSAPDAEGFPALPPGRQPTLRELDNGHVAMRWVDQTMDRFANYLAAQLRQPVKNETRLTGPYDFTMHWVMQASTDDTGPNLIRALQEQLGLRLESKNASVDMLVVDHIEKAPTQN